MSTTKSNSLLDVHWVDSILPAYSNGTANYLNSDNELIAGIYTGLENDVYHSLAAYSSTIIKTLAKSTPAHVYREFFSDVTRTRNLTQVRTLDTGTFGHELTLEPDDFYNRYYKLPLPKDHPNALVTAKQMSNKCGELYLQKSGSKQELADRLADHDIGIEIYVKIVEKALLKGSGRKAYTAACKLVESKAAASLVRAYECDNVKKLCTKQPIDGAVWSDAMRIQATFLGNRKASTLISDGFAELTVISKDPKTGLMLKVKFDYIRRDAIASDIKTARSADPYKFSRQCRELRYDIQAEFYKYVANLAGIPVELFAFIAIEYADADICEMFELTESRQSAAYSEMESSIRCLNECLISDNWYGYTKNNQVIVIN